MKKETFYKVVILLLLVLNFGILVFLWLHHPGRDMEGPQRTDRMIIRRLHLDKDQISRFEILKQEHHSQMMAIQEKSGKLHQQYFDLLKNNPVDTVAANKILDAIAQNTRERESVTFDHFSKLRAMLREDQKPLFDSFVQELGRQLMGPPPPPDGRPPR